MESSRAVGGARPGRGKGGRPGSSREGSLANGRLAPRPAEGSPRPLALVSQSHEWTNDAVAIAAALAQPWSDVVLSGAVTPAQVVSNLAATDLALSPDDLAELAVLAEPPERYWATRASLPWT